MTFKRSEISLAAEQNVNTHGGSTWSPAAQADYLAEKLGGPARGKAQMAIIQKLRGYALGGAKGHKFAFTDLVRGPEFRGIEFGKLMKAAEVLAKKGRVAYDGKTISLTEDAPDEPDSKPESMMAWMSRGSRTGQLTGLEEDALPHGGPTGGYNRHQKLMSPDTREKVFQARAQEIEAFAADRGYDPRIVMAIAEVSMRMGRVPDMRQYGVYGEEALAIRHFIAGDILNLAIEDERLSASILSEGLYATKQRSMTVPMTSQRGRNEFVISMHQEERHGSPIWYWNGSGFVPDGKGVKVFEARKAASKDLRAAKKAAPGFLAKKVGEDEQPSASILAEGSLLKKLMAPRGKQKTPGNAPQLDWNALSTVIKAAMRKGPGAEPHMFVQKKQPYTIFSFSWSKARGLGDRVGFAKYDGKTVTWRDDDGGPFAEYLGEFFAEVAKELGAKLDSAASRPYGENEAPSASILREGIYNLSARPAASLAGTDAHKMAQQIATAIAPSLKGRYQTVQAQDVFGQAQSIHIRSGNITPEMIRHNVAWLNDAYKFQAIVSGFNKDGSAGPKISVEQLSGGGAGKKMRKKTVKPGKEHLMVNHIKKYVAGLMKDAPAPRAEAVEVSVSILRGEEPDESLDEMLGMVRMQVDGMIRKWIKKHGKAQLDKLRAAIHKAVPDVDDESITKRLAITGGVGVKAEAEGLTESGDVQAAKDLPEFTDLLGSKKLEALREVAPPGFSGTVAAMKDSPADIDNPWALAWHMHGKGNKPHFKPEKGKPRYKSPEKYAADRKKAEEQTALQRTQARFAEILGCRLSQTQAPSKYTM